MTERAVFDLVLDELRLECGARLPFRRVRGWAWGPPGTTAYLRARGAAIVATDGEIPARETVVPGRHDTAAPTAFDASVSPPWPVVTLVHALTGDMRAGGPGGWWAPTIGPGQPIDPTRHLVVCFNNLGGCYGSTGPADAEFPARALESAPRHAPPVKGGFVLPDTLPATLTSWDQARTHIDTLDALGIPAVELLAGGSVGGSQVLCMAMLAPDRFRRVVPFAANLAASPWILAWNHVGRQTVLACGAERGLELARQIAHVTYRAAAGLEQRHGRRMTTDDHAWSSGAVYDVQTYLEHQGRKLTARYSALAYLAALDAMDHHDVLRRPPDVDPTVPWSLARVRASVLVVTIDSDQLFVPADGDALWRALAEAGVHADRFVIGSPHGHDAFLIEWDQVRDALARAWAMPAGEGG